MARWLALVTALVVAVATGEPCAAEQRAAGRSSVEQQAELAEHLMRTAMRVVREMRDARGMGNPPVAASLDGAGGTSPDSPPTVAGAPFRAAPARSGGAPPPAGTASDALRAVPSASRPELADLDPDRAALIGVEYSPLMTTMGSLESKRLATHPLWARALVRQLHGHGVGVGNTVLASFSGSFPGLNIAVMAACRALGARLVAVSSVTASTWGADEPGFTWPEMESAIVRAGVLPVATVAVTLGGTRDSARDLSEEGRAIAVGIQKTTAISLGAIALSSGSLSEAVALRLATYRTAMGLAQPAAYINVGGNHASLGGARADLRHTEGWILSRPAGADAGASVILAWLVEGVPVLNLLDVKSLALAWSIR